MTVLGVVGSVFLYLLVATIGAQAEFRLLAVLGTYGGLISAAMLEQVYRLLP